MDLIPGALFLAVALILCGWMMAMMRKWARRRKELESGKSVAMDESIGAKLSWFPEYLEIENVSGADLVDLAVEFRKNASLRIGPWQKTNNALFLQSWGRLPAGEKVRTISVMPRMTAAKLTINGKSWAIPLPFDKK